MLTFEVPLVRVRMGGRVGFSESRQQPLPKQASPMAQCLALGHRIVQAVESGEMRGYGEIAQRMGVSQPRVSMLVALTFLSPRIQEAILAGEVGLGFRTLLKLSRLGAWKEQEALAGGAGVAVGRQIQERLKGAPHRRASHRYGGSYLETHIEGREIG